MVNLIQSVQSTVAASQVLGKAIPKHPMLVVKSIVAYKLSCDRAKRVFYLYCKRKRK